jgi:hypothetical protein
LLYKSSAFGRPLSSKVIGHANIKITERNATLTREHFQIIQIKMPARKQLFHSSQLAHPQSSTPKGHSIQPHLDICARAHMDSETPPRAANGTPLGKVLRFIQVPR